MTFAKGFATGAFTSLACFYLYNTKSGNIKNNIDILQDGIKRVPLSKSSPMLEDIQNLERQRRILKYGIPDQGVSVYSYENHMLAYDQARKIPIWVAEHITKDNVKGNANRKHSHFKPDPSVSARFNAQNEDYWKSGWSRGHMSPAGNHKSSQSAMNDSFLLSNIVPQNLENNAGFWNRFELYCRDLTKKYKDVRIITGPLFLPDLEQDGPLYIKYPVIGKRQVAVPTHLYKVVLVESENEQTQALGAFIVPNKPIGFDKRLTDFMVPLETLEERAGVTFLPKLNAASTKNLCSVESCDLMSQKKFDLYMITRRIQSARNLHQLQKAYEELDKKKLKPDQYVLDLYQKKELELKTQELMAEKQKNEL